MLTFVPRKFTMSGYSPITHTMYYNPFLNSVYESKDTLITPNNSQNFPSNSTQDTQYAESSSASIIVDVIPTKISNIQTFNPNTFNPTIYSNSNKLSEQRICKISKNYSENSLDRKYYETLVYENVGLVRILPEDILSWYPGFNLPIGTRGRSLLRKDLHRKRVNNISNSDIMLSHLNVTNRSTFGDMRIADLYHSAYILGIWNSAAHYCLETCERKGYKKEWILCLKESGYEININNLKHIKTYMLEKYNR